MNGNLIKIFDINTSVFVIKNEKLSLIFKIFNKHLKALIKLLQKYKIKYFYSTKLKI